MDDNYENKMRILLYSGQLLWRRVLEKGYAGQIRALGGVADGDLVSISGGVPAIVRAWDLATGHILHEWPIAEQSPDRLVFVVYCYAFSYNNLPTEIIRIWEDNFSMYAYYRT